jgi:hypothetical protein
MERIRHVAGIIFLTLLLAVMAGCASGVGPTPWVDRQENRVTFTVQNDNWLDARVLLTGTGVRPTPCRIPALTTGTCTSRFPLNGLMEVSVYLFASQEVYRESVLVSPGDKLSLHIRNNLNLSYVGGQSDDSAASH